MINEISGNNEFLNKINEFNLNKLNEIKPKKETVYTASTPVSAVERLAFIHNIPRLLSRAFNRIRQLFKFIIVDSKYIEKTLIRKTAKEADKKIMDVVSEVKDTTFSLFFVSKSAEFAVSTVITAISGGNAQADKGALKVTSDIFGVISKIIKTIHVVASAITLSVYFVRLFRAIKLLKSGEITKKDIVYIIKRILIDVLDTFVKIAMLIQPFTEEVYQSLGLKITVDVAQIFLSIRQLASMCKSIIVSLNLRDYKLAFQNMLGITSNILKMLYIVLKYVPHAKVAIEIVGYLTQLCMAVFGFIITTDIVRALVNVAQEYRKTDRGEDANKEFGIAIRLIAKVIDKLPGQKVLQKVYDKHNLEKNKKLLEEVLYDTYDDNVSDQEPLSDKDRIKKRDIKNASQMKYYTDYNIVTQQTSESVDEIKEFMLFLNDNVAYSFLGALADEAQIALDQPLEPQG